MTTFELVRRRVRVKRAVRRAFASGRPRSVPQWFRVTLNLLRMHGLQEEQVDREMLWLFGAMGVLGREPVRVLP